MIRFLDEVIFKKFGEISGLGQGIFMDFYLEFSLQLIID